MGTTPKMKTPSKVRTTHPNVKTAKKWRLRQESSGIMPKLPWQSLHMKGWGKKSSFFCFLMFCNILWCFVIFGGQTYGQTDQQTDLGIKAPSWSFKMKITIKIRITLKNMGLWEVPCKCQTPFLLAGLSVYILEIWAIHQQYLNHLWSISKFGGKSRYSSYWVALGSNPLTLY